MLFRILGGGGGGGGGGDVLLYNLYSLKRSNVYRNNTDVLALFCVQLTSSFLEFRSLLRFLVALTNVQVSEDQINFVQVGLFIL